MFKCNIEPRCSDVSLGGSEVDLFACFFLCRRLLLDMVPRVRQTRNYERFEWRITEGGFGSDWQDGDCRGPPQTITISPRGASEGVAVCAVLPFRAGVEDGVSGIFLMFYSLMYIWNVHLFFRSQRRSLLFHASIFKEGNRDKTVGEGVNVIFQKLYTAQTAVLRMFNTSVTCHHPVTTEQLVFSHGSTRPLLSCAIKLCSTAGQSDWCSWCSGGVLMVFTFLWLERR